MYYLGIDLGGTNAAAGIVNEKYEIISKASVPTNAKNGVDAIVANIAKAAQQAITEAKLTAKDIESIGIGSPGAVDPENGVVDFAALTIRRWQSLSAHISPAKRYCSKTMRMSRHTQNTWRGRQKVRVTV